MSTPAQELQAAPDPDTWRQRIADNDAALAEARDRLSDLDADVTALLMRQAGGERVPSPLGIA